MRVKFTARARRDVLDIGLRWRRTHPAAPGLFDDELTDALLMLADHPLAGREVHGRTLKGARLVVLVDSEFLLFYRVVRRSHVSILRVRQGARKTLIET